MNGVGMIIAYFKVLSSGYGIYLVCFNHLRTWLGVCAPFGLYQRSWVKGIDVSFVVSYSFLLRNEGLLH